MKASNVKPITYMKTHSAELIKAVNENRSPVVITQNGHARAVVMDAASYEQMQDALILLRSCPNPTPNIARDTGSRRRKWKPTLKRGFQLEAAAGALDGSGLRGPV